ncbi:MULTISPECIES: SDR family NAD(P)-dependent oxidoreductase [unclassified Rhodococcus (in: high G+C Gram-positive bacteria)]|uniref:SDR family NAD(P)-dependent oxidoreductase n=1 Tax=unclassified Rhodococcus (in: high G+C Gram-positive bacteria) TaxID=192944 RepID=UPI0009F8A641|nr:SDR family NAD(P)-dependent oxidoreductase [Rhodococcus sp. M8]QPG47498.1 SDR family oxidoreductase [Rhodococcus sp. M8]
MNSVNGETALVTGAGQGVGRGIALALAAAGARVAVVGRTADKIEKVAAEIEERGGRAAAFVCDVTDAAGIDLLVERVIARFGGLSILVNNAQSTVHGRLLDLDEQVYQRGMDSGPTATLRLMRACHPHLKGGGSIVNLGSAAGVRWDPSGYGGYAAAKEAIRVLTRTAACEWAADGIRVNAILPLANSSALEVWAQESPDEARAYLDTVPLGRLGDPEIDIGPAVVFLCSPAARYITGHSLPIDGGQALMR